MEEERALANGVLRELEQLQSRPTEAKAKIGALRAKAQIKEPGFESQNAIRNRRTDAWLAISDLAKAIDEDNPELAGKWAKAIEKTKSWAN
jgi:hypothetical protein